MKLDTNRLEKPRERGDRIVARCPACAELGKDKAADNLVLFANGNFACAVYQGDSEHSKRILALAGASMPVRAQWHTPPPSREIEEAPLPPLTHRQTDIIRRAVEALGTSPEKCAAIAARRGWRAETVINAARDCTLGWLTFGEVRKPDPACPDEAVVFIYRSGCKVRWMAADGLKQLRWLKDEGLNHKALWRGELITADTRTVWLTEGEPDCLRLMDMGIGETAGNAEVVCALPDAGYRLRRSELDTLKGREVIFIADTDAAGQTTEMKLKPIFHKEGIQFSTVKL